MMGCREFHSISLGPLGSSGLLAEAPGLSPAELALVHCRDQIGIDVGILPRPLQAYSGFVAVRRGIPATGLAVPATHNVRLPDMTQAWL